MPTSAISSISVFLFSLMLVRVGGDTCHESPCQPGGPTIRFPFYLKAQNRRCGYPGFQLSCDHLKRTILHLEQSGDFVVEFINYDMQTISLRDPNDCLSERLLSLSLGGSPFSAEYYQNITFLKCSEKDFWLLSGVSIVWCLSDSLNIVGVTTSDPFIRTDINLNKCSMRTANVPLTDLQAISLSQSIWLKWDMEFCRICQSKGGRCQLQGYSDSVLDCYGIRQGLSRGSKFAILAGVMTLGILFIVGVAFYQSSKANRPINGRGLPLPTSSTPTDGGNIDEGDHRAMNRGILLTGMSITRGIDSPTIESYPKTQLDEDGIVPKPDHDVCTICLSKYKGQETIRTLPDCSHYFHAGCIDPWLKRNDTCPICRAQKTKIPQDGRQSSV